MWTRPTDRGSRRGASAFVSIAMALAMALTASAAVSGASLSPRELVPLLTRSGVGPDWTTIDVIYAPALFFESTGIPVPPDIELESSLVFVMNETVHEGELPLDAPQAYLLLPDAQLVPPIEASVTVDDIHHRTSRLVFPRPAGWLEAPAEGDGTLLRLVIPDRDGAYSVGNTFQWSLPIEVGGDA